MIHQTLRMLRLAGSSSAPIPDIPTRGFGRREQSLTLESHPRSSEPRSPPCGLAGEAGSIRYLKPHGAVQPGPAGIGRRPPLLGRRVSFVPLWASREPCSSESSAPARAVHRRRVPDRHARRLARAPQRTRCRAPRPRRDRGQVLRSSARATSQRSASTATTPCRRQREDRPLGPRKGKNRGPFLPGWFGLMGLIVIEPGLITTVQDGGRPGYREWGVPSGGAFDRGSAALANALLGNPASCAVLEMTLTGGIYRADGPLALALVPRWNRASSPDGRSEILRLPLSFSLRDGERLVVGRALSARGPTWQSREDRQTRPTLGSRSQCRLQSGEILPAAAAAIPTRHLSEPVWRCPTDEPVRVVSGPDSRLISAAEDVCRAANFVWARAAIGWASGCRVSQFRSPPRPSGSRRR